MSTGFGARINQDTRQKEFSTVNKDSEKKMAGQRGGVRAATPKTPKQQNDMWRT